MFCHIKLRKGTIICLNDYSVVLLHFKAIFYHKVSQAMFTICETPKNIKLLLYIRRLQFITIKFAYILLVFSFGLFTFIKYGIRLFKYVYILSTITPTE